MSRLLTSLLLIVLLGGALLLPAPQMVGVAQEPEPEPAPAADLLASPLDACRRGAFSTEEDFMMTKGEPFDGNPYISDGDLLSFTGQVCARNAALLAVFFGDKTPVDLGLDAADILDFSERRPIAFSTELDDPYHNFTAGDLLVTTGAIIPNVALLAPFKIGHDVGLDSIQFMGDTSKILEFLNEARTLGRARYVANPDILKGQLLQWGIDIWISIEGTARTAEGRMILDGDLLSARGLVIATNAELLANSVPAGIPQRGVDFGLDAVAGSRSLNAKDVLESLRFSTEILFNGEPGFTDGDILRYKDGVWRHNQDLIAPFYPNADFLGLDVLWLPLDVPPSQSPNIQTMCGNRAVADFNGGLILPDEAPGTGLYRKNSASSPPGLQPRQPCGYFVPVDGYLPSLNIKRFRVAFRPATDLTVPVIGSASGIRTNWTLYNWDTSLAACLPTGSLGTDANGWMDAADYMEAKLGGPSTGFCSNPGLRLAVWDTANQAGFGPPDQNLLYRLWLEWEDSSSVLHREPFDHTIQLDNKKPEINDLKITLADGTTPVQTCGKAPKGNSVFNVYGRFSDAFYWYYQLNVYGGNPPAALQYGPHNYYDGTAPVVNTDDTGTTPDGSTVLLRSINMNDPPMKNSFVDCCYVLYLWVSDAAIRHTFDGLGANDASGSTYWMNYAFVTFGAAP